MKLGVLGAGSWGTAIAQAIGSLSRSEAQEILLWTRDADHAREVTRSRINERYLPGIELARAIHVTSEPGQLADAALIFVAVPVQTIRTVLEAGSFHAPVMVSCAKGLETESGLRPSEIIQEQCRDAKVGAMSGPSFAGEVAQGLPTGLSLALPNLDDAQDFAAALAAPAFRLYPSDDLIGVELGGALKNVVAIAAGVVMGKKLGENARAALIARGLAEITRLASSLGARPETMMGLAGLGDTLLTATSLTSRNTKFGFDLARGEPISGALAEGRFTAAAACSLAERSKIDLPISRAVRDVINNHISVDEAIETLLNRPLPAKEWTKTN